MWSVSSTLQLILGGVSPSPWDHHNINFLTHNSNTKPNRFLQITYSLSNDHSPSSSNHNHLGYDPSLELFGLDDMPPRFLFLFFFVLMCIFSLKRVAFTLWLYFRSHVMWWNCPLSLSNVQWKQIESWYTPKTFVDHDLSLISDIRILVKRLFRLSLHWKNHVQDPSSLKCFIESF